MSGYVFLSVIVAACMAYLSMQVMVVVAMVISMHSEFYLCKDDSDERDKRFKLVNWFLIGFALLNYIIHKYLVFGAVITYILALMSVLADPRLRRFRRYVLVPAGAFLITFLCAMGFQLFSNLS